MLKYITDTNWRRVGTDVLDGLENALVWMIRLTVFASVLFLVTVEAGASPQEQLDIVTVTLQATFLLAVVSIPFAATISIFDQHEQANTEV